jgi:hypothetical protein
MNAAPTSAIPSPGSSSFPPQVERNLEPPTITIAKIINSALRVRGYYEH